MKSQLETSCGALTGRKIAPAAPMNDDVIPSPAYIQKATISDDR
jgi:hypothetical protein